jgi:signal-transduction protein with cAMP-binding, CBS, and nucleotidyltransferase domain
MPLGSAASDEEDQMKAQEAMRHAPVELPVDATIGEAARLMDDRAVGAVVLTDDQTGRPVGIVTDRDLVVRAMARNIPPDARVDSVMSMGVTCLDADADLHDAVRLFATHPIRRLPLVAGDRMVGMLTVDDLLVDLSSDLSNVVRGLTAQVLFGHPEAKVPAAESVV